MLKIFVIPGGYMQFLSIAKKKFKDLFELLLKIKTDRLTVQVFRYGAVNAICLVIDFIGLYILTEWSGLNYLVSAAISFMIGNIINYLLCVSWVFHEKRFESKSIEFSGFILIGIAGMGVNTALLWLLTDMAGLYYLWSRCISAVIGFFLKYLARKHALFVKPTEVPS